MMKHLFSFLIIASLLLFGCRSKTQSNFQPELSEQAEESYSLPEEYAEEVIVTGKVLNRDFYPNEKDLTLIIPFFTSNPQLSSSASFLRLNVLSSLN